MTYAIKKKYLKPMKILDCALIGVCVVIRLKYSIFFDKLRVLFWACIFSFYTCIHKCINGLA